MTDLVQEKVAAWNKYYYALDREVRFKDMDADEYESVVADALLEVCDGNPELAAMVLDHNDCEGGWMVGDVAGVLADMISKSRGQGGPIASEGASDPERIADLLGEDIRENNGL